MWGKLCGNAWQQYAKSTGSTEFLRLESMCWSMWLSCVFQVELWIIHRYETYCIGNWEDKLTTKKNASSLIRCGRCLYPTSMNLLASLSHRIKSGGERFTSTPCYSTIAFKIDRVFKVLFNSSCSDSKPFHPFHSSKLCYLVINHNEIFCTSFKCVYNA